MMEILDSKVSGMTSWWAFQSRSRAESGEVLKAMEIFESDSK